MKLEKNDLIILVSIYFIVVVDILLSGIMLDIIAVLIGVALYLLFRKEKIVQSIFFVSALVFLFLAIILYSINSQYLPYNSAANWSYLFFFFGVLRMLIDSSSKKEGSKKHA